MDPNELSRQAQDLEQTMSRTRDSIESSKREASDLEDEISNAKRVATETIDKAAMAVSDNKALRVATDKLEDAYQRDHEEKTRRVQEIEDEIHDLENLMREADSALSNIRTHEQFLQNYQSKVDADVNQAEQVLKKLQ